MKNKARVKKIRGAGIWDRIKNIVKTNAYKWSTDALLEQIGNGTVTAIQVCRDPIAGAIDTVLNALSLGKWQSLKDQQGTDKFFHLYSIITVNGQQYILEKNANINLAKNDKSPKEQISIPISNPVTLNQMLERTKQQMGEDRYFQYNAFSNNCQDFLLAFISSNGLLSPEAQSFIKQDITQLAKEMPEFTKSVSKLATDIGHAVGAGIHKKSRLIKKKNKKQR